jgi:hypothetical protein
MFGQEIVPESARARPVSEPAPGDTVRFMRAHDYDHDGSTSLPPRGRPTSPLRSGTRKSKRRRSPAQGTFVQHQEAEEEAIEE